MITSKFRVLRAASLAFVALFASVALAQTAPGAGFTTTGPTTATVVNDGTGGTVVNGVSRVAVGTTTAPMATIQLTSTQNAPVQISSIPLNFTFTGGASPSNLSNCQLVNSSGTALNTGSNTLNTLGSGSNTITLDTPFVIGAGSTQNLALRCTVSSTTPVGSTFQVAANPAAASFFYPASLAVTSTAMPGIQNNTSTIGNVTLGTVRLDATQSGSPIRVTSVPISAATLGSATAGSVSNCQLYDPNIIPLNTGANIGSSLVAGSNTVILNVPLIVPAGGSTTLVLRCTVLPGTGGTLVLLPGAGTFTATNATTGASVTPSISTLTTSPFSIGGAVVVPPIIPGVPSTGLGDHTTGILSAILAAFVLLAGGILFRNRKVNG